jgi:hypothetical protein
LQLRAKWIALVDSTSQTSTINVCKDLSAVTLDIIGLAGFDYAFDTLSRPADDPTELSAAFDAMSTNAQEVNLWAVLSYFFPVLNRVVSWVFCLSQNTCHRLFSSRLQPTKANRTMWQAKEVMDRIGLDLVNKKKAAVAASEQNSDAFSQSRDRDLLSCLVRANMSEDPAKRLPDHEVLAREFCPLRMQLDMLMFSHKKSPSLSWPDMRPRLLALLGYCLLLPSALTFKNVSEPSVDILWPCLHHRQATMLLPLRN